MSGEDRRLPRSRTAKIALPTVAALGAGGAFAVAPCAPAAIHCSGQAIKGCVE